MPPAAAPRRFRTRLALLIVLVVAGLITHGTFAGSGDEPHYEMIAHSIVFDGDLDLANDYAEPGNLIAEGGLAPELHARLDVHGVLRPVHDIGLPALLAPYFGAAYLAAQAAGRALPADWLARAKVNESILLRHLLSLAMSGFAAWIAVLLFDRFARVATPGAALGWAALAALSPPLLSHAFLFFPDIVTAAVALWLFTALTADGPPRRPLLMGLATGGLFLLHARNAGLVGAFAALMAWRAWRTPGERTAARGFFAGLAAALAVRTAVIYYFWGTFLTTPHARFQAPDGLWPIVREVAIRVAGWTVDQEHGLLPYAPLYLLVPVGWFALRRRAPRTWAALTFVAAAYVAAIALPFLNPHGWRGGWSPAARFLVPIVPLLAILVFEAVQWIGAARWWLRALVIVQILLDVVWWQMPKLLWNDGIGTARAAFLHPLPSFVEPVRTGVLAAVLVLLIAWVAISAMTVRLTALGPTRQNH